jgi:hypothetical protein
MNRTEINSFQMQEMEIETLREQIQKQRDNMLLLQKAFIFLQGEVVGKQLNTQHPNYPYYQQYIQLINK